MDQFPIKTASIEEKHYPEILRKIPNPPKLLYYRGNNLLGDKEKTFAVVGARRYSPYGKAVTLEIVSRLNRAGLTIVSGLAPGIDTFAHCAVLENKGRTIAVLGTGLDKNFIYPQLNLKLAEKILKLGGVLISEYPPQTPGSKFSFPQRNRIIAGLSLGTLIIEAKERSGALITAGFAREQKRQIFAVPGSIFASNSAGSNNLIKIGARLTTCAEDILKELGIKEETENKNLEIRNDKEKLILNSLQGGPLEVDAIIRNTKLSSNEILSTLVILESEELVRDLGGGVYALKK